MYATGKGLAKNYSEAWKWYSLAIKQKHPNAADNRLRLAHAMTRAQVAEVDKNIVLHSLAWVHLSIVANLSPIL
jgi:TPR repeat protein